MNKGKYIFGIIITVMGGIIMLTSMIFGITKLVGFYDEEINIFPAKLTNSPSTLETNSFSIKGNSEISVWLKLPNRQIEGENFTLIISFVEKDANTKISFEKSFSFWHTRSSSGHGQYYKLGSHLFGQGFEGHLTAVTEGTWIPPHNGWLVIRRSKDFATSPLKQIGYFMIGVFILITGIVTIIKNSR